jgi:hypothetical protein
MHSYRPEFFESLATSADLSTRELSPNWRTSLGDFAQRVSLKEICQAILADSELISQVAASSYRHPNGFDKLIVYRDEIGALIKLDVWWEDDTFWGLVHNQRFDFSSIVLSGELQLRHYLTVEPTEGDSHGIFKMSVLADARGVASDAQHVRRGVIKTWDGSMPRGGFYDMECTMFHQAAGTAGLVTTTLVVQGAPRRHYSEVVTERDPWTGLIPFTPAEVEQKLTRLASL